MPQVCKMVHDAVKSALGKPDQYITVALMKAECVTVAGKEASVVGEPRDAGLSCLNRLVEAESHLFMKGIPLNRSVEVW